MAAAVGDRLCALPVSCGGGTWQTITCRPFLAPTTRAHSHATLSRAGKPRRWDMVESHPSVAVLLYHRQRQAVVLVRQVRCARCAHCAVCAVLFSSVLQVARRLLWSAHVGLCMPAN